MEVLNDIIRFFTETPFLLLVQYGLVLFAWPPIAGVFIWGLLQIWQDHKQGQYAGNLKWMIYKIQVPGDSIQTPKGMENFFNLLAGAKSSVTWKEGWLFGKFQPWFSLEIVSEGGRISFYIRTQTKYDDMVQGAIYSQYPEAQIVQVEDYAKDWPEEFPNDDYKAWGSMVETRRPSFMPIKTYVDFEHMGEKDQRFKDPLLVVLEQMGRMKPDEIYAIQILIMAVEEQDDWRNPGLKFLEEKYGKAAPKPKSSNPLGSLAWIPAEMVNQIAGGGLSLGGEDAAGADDDFAMFRLNPEDQDVVKAVARKISKIGWWTKIRFVYIAKPESFRKGSIASMSKGIFHQYGTLNMNKLGLHGKSTPKDDYFWMEWGMAARTSRLLKRYKGRSFGAGSNAFALNSEELATLFHFPAGDSRTPVLAAPPAKMAEAPMDLQFVGDDVPTIPVENPNITKERKVAAAPQPLVVPRPGQPAQVQPQPQQPAVQPPTQPATPQAPPMPAPAPPTPAPAPPAAPTQHSRPVGMPAPQAKGISEPIPEGNIGGAPPNLPI